MREPIKIVVILDDGLVQDILISSGRGEAYVLDYDVEGLDPEEIMTGAFPAEDDKPGDFTVLEEASVRHWDKLMTDPKFIDRLERDFAEYKKKYPKLEGNQ
jgi:hypothetical protein